MKRLHNTYMSAKWFQLMLEDAAQKAKASDECCPFCALAPDCGVCPASCHQYWYRDTSNGRRDEMRDWCITAGRKLLRQMRACE